MAKDKPTPEKKYSAIDGDTMKLIRKFTDAERAEVLEELAISGKYGEIGEDIDGDLICYQNQ